MAKEIYKVRSPSNGEYNFRTRYEFESQNIETLAKAVAQDEYERFYPDLNERDGWPITYEILWEGEWQKVSIDMEYHPQFFSTKIKPE